MKELLVSDQLVLDEYTHKQLTSLTYYNLHYLHLYNKEDVFIDVHLE